MSESRLEWFKHKHNILSSCQFIFGIEPQMQDRSAITEHEKRMASSGQLMKLVLVLVLSTAIDQAKAIILKLAKLRTQVEKADVAKTLPPKHKVQSRH